MHSASDAIILCGGAGHRLRSLTTAPKAMAVVAGRPFLELLLLQLKRYSIEHVILAVGYRSEAIHTYFGDEAFGLRLVYSAEQSPLGTGGALRQAADLMESELALVMNGDSYTDADIRGFGDRHRASKADVSVLVVPVDGRADCGMVTMEHGDRIALFREKQDVPGSKYVNAGMYFISGQIINDIPLGLRISLEEDVFPLWLAEGRYIRAHTDEAQCIDIGTPERYWKAQALFARTGVGRVLDNAVDSRDSAQQY